MDRYKQQINDMIAIQLMATAKLQFEMASALIGKGQDELRKHFASSAELMIKAAQALKGERP